MENFSMQQLEAKCVQLGIDPKSIPETPCDGQQALKLRMTIELLQKEKAKGEVELKRQIFFRDAWHKEVEETKTKLLESQFRIQELEEICEALQQPTSSGSGGASGSLPMAATDENEGDVEDEEEETTQDIELGDIKLDLVDVGENVNADGEDEADTGEDNESFDEANGMSSDSGINGSQQESLEETRSVEEQEQHNAPEFIVPDLDFVTASSETPSLSRSRPKRNAPPPPKWVAFKGFGGVPRRATTAPATTTDPNPSSSLGNVTLSMETVARSLIPAAASSVAGSVAGGVRKNKCNYCDLKLHTPHLLSTHIQSVHRDGKMWICNKCPQKYACSKSLKVHYDADHLKKRFPCPRCHQEYRSLLYMNIHKKKCRVRVPK